MTAYMSGAQVRIWVSGRLIERKTVKGGAGVREYLEALPQS